MAETNSNSGNRKQSSLLASFFAILRPSHAHTAFTATLLLMATTLLSRIIGLVRVKYIAWQFGAGPLTDAYLAAFRLPDLMNYVLVGGAASITFVTILNRYREQGDEAEGERVLSIVINVVGLILIVGITICMFLAGPYIHYLNPGFEPWKVELSARMTRILLPGQLFFFIGGVLGATLLVRRQFLYQGLTGILYNFGIILGGVIFAHSMGIPALAVGALLGAFAGSFLLNAWGAWRAGVRYSWGIDLHHPGLREWLFMTLPLMAGFTLPFLDDYIVGYYASHGAGDITRLMNAKQLFSAPMAVLAQAAGAASMPFFARLWAQEKRYEFAVGVADSASRVVSLGLLAAAWMTAMAQPLVHLIFIGGRFNPADVRSTAIYFAIYALSLFFWSAQAIYARAFYAAGITWLPMIAGSIVTLIALPIYYFGYHLAGAWGLALASDVGIGLQCVTLAILLHKRRMVSLASLNYAEIRRCLCSGLLAFAATWTVLHLIVSNHLRASRPVDLLELGLGSILWLAVAFPVLHLAGSSLPSSITRKLAERFAR